MRIRRTIISAILALSAAASIAAGTAASVTGTSAPVAMHQASYLHN